MRKMRMGHVVVVATVAVIATACSAGQFVPPTTQIGFPPPSQSTTSVPPIPAVVTSATPSGWVPVAYGDAQVSVPVSFSVFYPGENPCELFSTPGALFIAPTPTTIFCPANTGSGTVVRVVAIHQVPRPYDTENPTLLNGVPVYMGANDVTLLSYYAPSLGVEISARGTLARRVIATFTRSPRTVALASGPAPSVPSGWHTVTFQGLAFDTPQLWTVTHTQGTDFGLGAICQQAGVALGGTGVTLDTDKGILPVPSCTAMTSNPPQPPNDGVQVDAGRFDQFVAILNLSFSTQCLDLHGLTVCPATTPNYSILVLQATVPGRTMPVIVSIGLAGNGLVTRAILYSLKAA